MLRTLRAPPPPNRSHALAQGAVPGDRPWVVRRPAIALALIAIGLLLACGPTTIADPAAPRPAIAPTGAATPPLDMPGPARAREEQAVTANAACEACHPAEAAEWRRSLHRTADLEPSYRRAFAVEPLPFCRGCHAPEADPDAPESEAVAALGVGCVTCHVTNGDVLAAPWTGPGAPPPAPHPVARDARFATDAACARCHEFGFPGTLGRDPGEKMQWTVTEHARSGAAATACAGCHMPRHAAGRRSHTFAASRDPAVLAAAVHIEARRVDAGRVSVVLSPKGAGHAFPTGDLFRRIEVLAEVQGPDHMVLASAVRFLGRHFEPRSHGAGRRLLRDDRVHTEPVAVLLELTEAAATWPIAYRVAYQRVDHPNGPDEEAATVDGEVVLAQGVLPPPSTPFDKTSNTDLHLTLSTSTLTLTPAFPTSLPLPGAPRETP